MRISASFGHCCYCYNVWNLGCDNEFVFIWIWRVLNGQLKLYLVSVFLNFEVFACFPNTLFKTELFVNHIFNHIISEKTNSDLYKCLGIKKARSINCSFCLSMGLICDPHQSGDQIILKRFRNYVCLCAV